MYSLPTFCLRMRPMAFRVLSRLIQAVCPISPLLAERRPFAVTLPSLWTRSSVCAYAGSSGPRTTRLLDSLLRIAGVPSWVRT